MLTMALRAARKGAEVIDKALQHRDLIKIEEKSRNDYVTEVDKAVEKEVIYHLKKAYPEHSFLGEESGIIDTDSDYQWIIDPIDGTTNFVYGIPHFAISIACVFKGKVEHAVVLDPSKREEFTASRGKGAMLNGRRLRVSDRKIKPYLESMENILEQQTSGIRRMGAASLDLAYVAAGRYDGFWEMKLSPWDMAAGMLLVTEAGAGGFISDFKGGNRMLDSGNVVCGPNKVFKPLLSIVGKHLQSLQD